MARRRRESGEAETPESFVDVAELATRDTIAVARRGLRATPHHETVLFNMLQGFLGCLRVRAALDLGMRRGWWPFREVTVGGRHIHHFVPGIVLAFASAIAGMTTRATGSSRRRRPLRGWGGADPGRGGAAARPPRRLLDARGSAQCPGEPRRHRHPRGLDPRAPSLPPGRGEGEEEGLIPHPRDRQHRRRRSAGDVCPGRSYTSIRRRYAMEHSRSSGRDRRAGRVRRSQ